MLTAFLLTEQPCVVRGKIRGITLALHRADRIPDEYEWEGTGELAGRSFKILKSRREWYYYSSPIYIPHLLVLETTPSVAA